MSKLFFVMHEASKALIERYDLKDRDEAVKIAERLAVEDLKSRYVVLEAVARTSELTISVKTEFL